MLAKRGKSRQGAVRRFEQAAEHRLQAIRQALVSKTFTTSPYRIKKIYEPKTRDIFVLPFAPDRIVQHALMAVLEPIWDRMFIDDSYCCRKGKGIHAGSRRAMEFVRGHRYCLKCDVAKFYPSIDHDTLYTIIEKRIKCPDTLWLLRQIIYSVPGGKNTPIGNYTSQWFGNLYLHELDMLVKHRLRVKAYLRYCDDFCLFHDDKEVLNDWAKQITFFLEDRLSLRLSKCDLFPTSRGLDFLGYRHFPKGYVLLRKRTAKRLQRRLRLLPKLLGSRRLPPEKARSVLASARGWMQWANTKNLAVALRVDELERLVAGRLADEKI